MGSSQPIFVGGIAYSTDYTTIGDCLTIDNPPVSFAAQPPLTRVSEAQSAVVNDSPVDCQSR